MAFQQLDSIFDSTLLCMQRGGSQVHVKSIPHVATLLPARFQQCPGGLAHTFSRSRCTL